MPASHGAIEPIGLEPVEFSSAQPSSLVFARRRARAALIVLWAGFLASLAVLPEDAILAIAVLLAGISTTLESVHGAQAFDRLLRRVARKPV